MRNRPEYCETLAAAVKARLTHVNVNYRYTPDEVFYIFDNSDATVVVYGAEFRANIEAIRDRLPLVRLYVEVGEAAPPPFAENFETLAAEGDGSPLAIPRSGDDQFFIYTGGTTGMPKGVMWTHHAMREVGQMALRKLGPVPETLEAYAVATVAAPGGPAVIGPPLMHGTGLLTALATTLGGGTVITLPSVTFSATEMLDAAHTWRAQNLTIVGDPFARPLLFELDANAGRWDLSSVERIGSSGVMWSVEVKRGLLRHMPQAVLSDAFSSSEALGMGVSLMTAAGEVQTAKFALGDRARVYADDGSEVQPGSGVPAFSTSPSPTRSATTRTPTRPRAPSSSTPASAGASRRLLPGGGDGSLTLLGRGSACINTAGEKVFPEEVEEALKTHDSIEDVLVVGVPDPRWGQSVTAVVHLAPGARLDEQALQAHCRRTLAGYKTPKRIVTGEVNLRAPNGKADYKSAAQFAAAALTPQGAAA
jgi:fatty-acyl-CoA synthase